MKLTITVTVGSIKLSTDLDPALCERVNAMAKATGRGVQSLMIGAIDMGMSDLEAREHLRELQDRLLPNPYYTTLPEVQADGSMDVVTRAAGVVQS